MWQTWSTIFRVGLPIMYKTVLTFSWTISADWLLIVFIRCSDWLSILFMRWTPKITPAVVIVISRPVIAITPSPDTTGDLRSSLWVWPAYSKSPFIFYSKKARCRCILLFVWWTTVTKNWARVKNLDCCTSSRLKLSVFKIILYHLYTFVHWNNIVFLCEK